MNFLTDLHRQMRAIPQLIRTGDLAGLSKQKNLKHLVTGKLSGLYFFFFLIPDG
jgi:hypothetical protein